MEAARKEAGTKRFLLKGFPGTADLSLTLVVAPGSQCATVPASGVYVRRSKPAMKEGLAYGVIGKHRDVIRLHITLRFLPSLGFNIHRKDRGRVIDHVFARGM